MLLPESKLSFLRRSMLGGVPDVGCIDGLQVATFPLSNIVARTDDVWSAPRPCLYWRPYYSIKDRAFWAYYNASGVHVAAQSRGTGQAGKCAATRFGSRRPARNLSGCPAFSAVSLAV